MRVGALLLVLLLAGCTGAPTPAPATVRVPPPPTDGEHATCPPPASRGLAIAFRAEETPSASGRAQGIHRLDDRTFLFVWAAYRDSLREDDVTRIRPVDVARDALGVLHVCSAVDVATPVEVDAEPRSYDVAVRFVALDPLPEGDVRMTVNWVAGCSCGIVPRGNMSALFD